VSRKFTPFCTEDLGDIGYTGTWVIFLNRWAAVTGVKKESSGWAFGAGVGSFDFQVLGLDDVVLLLFFVGDSVVSLLFAIGKVLPVGSKFTSSSFNQIVLIITPLYSNQKHQSKTQNHATPSSKKEGDEEGQKCPEASTNRVFLVQS
jgi:hypothetical protein